MGRFGIILALALSVVAAAAPEARAAPLDVTVFTTGLTPNSAPTGIARGWDGNVWFTENADPGRIGRVTPDGAITEFSAGLTPNAGPNGITPGPDGNVWFVESRRAAVGRITPDGVITEYVLGISTGSEPQDIVTGPDGNLWFTELAGRIGRIMPSGVVTEFSAGMPADARPQGIAGGPDGNLWFTDASTAGRIGRITPSGVITTFDDGVPADSIPYDITPGADGNLWFTMAGADRIGRITPDGSVTVFDGLRGNAEPVGITLGPDGKVWFAERRGARIGSVAPAGTIEEHTAGLNAADAATGITAGPRGSVWFTQAGDPGAVAVIGGVGPPESTVGLPPPTPEPPPALPGESAAATIVALQDLVPQLQDWALPLQGRTFLVTAVSGQVYTTPPGGGRTETVTTSRNIPVGSRLDVVDGVVALVAALPDGRYQLATFKDGRFDARQSATGNGMVRLVLRGNVGCVEARISRLPIRFGRRLWARDRRGRWQTHGRDSVGTVRGTTWITEDRCEGTLTIVKRGSVRVRDRATGRRVLVRAGQSYLARRR